MRGNFRVVVCIRMLLFTFALLLPYCVGYVPEDLKMLWRLRARGDVLC